MQLHKAVPSCIWLLLLWWMVFRRTDITAAESLGHLLGVTQWRAASRVILSQVLKVTRTVMKVEPGFSG